MDVAEGNGSAVWVKAGVFVGLTGRGVTVMVGKGLNITVAGKSVLVGMIFCVGAFARAGKPGRGVVQAENAKINQTRLKGIRFMADSPSSTFSAITMLLQSGGFCRCLAEKHCLLDQRAT